VNQNLLARSYWNRSLSIAAVDCTSWMTTCSTRPKRCKTIYEALHQYAKAITPAKLKAGGWFVESVLGQEKLTSSRVQ